MRPVRSAPWLFFIHGIGAGLYNERDRDPATGTVVKTHCLCFIFVPILALGAFRVYPRGSGWTLIGKVPLSLRLVVERAVPAGHRRMDRVGCLARRAPRPRAYWNAATNRPQPDSCWRPAGSMRAARNHNQHAAACQRCVELVKRPELDSMPMEEVVEIFKRVFRAPLNQDDSEVVRNRAKMIALNRAKEGPDEQEAAKELVHMAIARPR